MECEVVHVKPLTGAWHIDTDQYISIVIIVYHHHHHHHHPVTRCLGHTSPPRSKKEVPGVRAEPGVVEVGASM